MKPTEEQQDIIDFVSKDNKSGIGKADAGSGKSSLVKMIVEECYTAIPRIGAFVFNNLAQKELDQKLGGRATCLTSHTLGYRPLKAKGKYRIPPKFSKSWINEFMDNEDGLSYRSSRESEEVTEDRNCVKDLVHFARVTLTDFNSLDALYEMATDRNINLGSDPENNIRYASKAIKDHIRILARDGQGFIDFDDMIFLPIHWDIELPQFELTIVDEAQDTSAMARELYSRTVSDKGKMLAVGDPLQAIYGFAGADNDSLDKIQERFDCVEYPLSINWRCDENIIKEAQTISTSIRCRPGAPKGEVAMVSVDYFDDNIKLGDMVLCRFTAPLVPICVGLIKKGMKAYVKGKDIGAEIAGMVKKVESLSEKLDIDFEEALTGWAEDEESKLKKRKMKAASIEALWDRVDVVRHFSSDGMSPSGIIQKLQDIFKDGGAGVELSTIHRQKGGEADRVWIIDIKKIRMSRPEMTPQEREQEKHVEYVAKTRARKAMFYVDLEAKDNYINLYPEENENNVEIITEVKKPSFEELLGLKK